MVGTAEPARTVAAVEAAAMVAGPVSGAPVLEAVAGMVVAVEMEAAAVVDAGVRLMVYTWWQPRFRPNIEAR